MGSDAYFNWYGDDPSIVVKPQSGIGVSFDECNIYIYSQGDHPTEDIGITIPLEHAMKVARTIMTIADARLTAMAASEDLDNTLSDRSDAAKDRTAADRQRRYRERRRNERGVTPVTGRDVPDSNDPIRVAAE